MSTVACFHAFDTTIGTLAIAWSEVGIAGVFLPEANATALRRRIARRFPDAREAAPPPSLRHAASAIAALLRGERTDLTAIALDMRGVNEFERRVYETARTIPAGKTASYGEIAERLGDKALAHEVGQALGRNPFSIVVPCHRVLAAGGKPGGFSARGGRGTKLRLLSIEGVQIAGTLPLFAAPCEEPRD